MIQPADLPILDIRALSRHFGSLKAVDHVSFTANQGQVVGFIGPNGAGKTTTMRMLATLEEPTSGTAYVGGYCITDHPDYVRKIVGYMPDATDKYANMSVEDYLDFYARSYGLRGSQRRDAIDRVMVFTELRKLRLKPIKKLSKGMSQRLGLGRTLIHDPQLLILDEPAAGLDPRARVELRELVRLLAGELGKTVLISSHILTELGEICDSLLVIEAGKILASGDVQEIQKQLQTGQSGSQVVSIVINTKSTTDHDTNERLHRWLLEQPFVETVQPLGGKMTIDFSGDEDQQHELLRRLIENAYPIVDFHGKPHSLEDAFMKITEGITQ